MWIDRLTQASLKALPVSIDSGRYQRSQSIDRLNEHSAIQPGELLVSDGSDHCQLSSDRGSFKKPAIDNPERITLFKQAILTLGETLTKAGNFNNPITGAKSLLSPLLPAAVIDADLDLLPVERALQSALEKGHLHEIAHHPRMDIHYTEEITDVARAKRLAKGALVHLASHSECWQRQTLSGVVPKKVKARFSEDDYQIYENRVFARLIDKLYQHLNSRIRTVEQLQQTLSDALGFEDNPNSIDYRISQKICALWGQTFDAEATLQAMELLESTLLALKSMQKSISSLRQSGLYLMIPRHAQIGATLHRTNILNHDAHYRHLAVLWDQLNRLQQTSQLSPAQRFAQEQILVSHYSHYAGLMLQHALAGNPQVQLSSSQPPYSDPCLERTVVDYNWAGQTLRLQQHDFDWSLSLLSQGHQSSSEASKQTLLEFTPWLGFSPIPDLEKPIDANRIILWPSIDNISYEQAEDQQPGWYALSPLDLYCVERLGWLVDKKLNEQLIRHYAKPIEKIPTQAVAVINKIQQNSKTLVELTGTPPKLHLLAALPPKDVASLKQALHDGNAASQAKQLQHQQDAITALEQCPVCEGFAPLTNQSLTGFRLECQGCGTSRYLKHSDAPLDIRFKEKDINEPIGSGFAARGRWALIAE